MDVVTNPSLSRGSALAACNVTAGESVATGKAINSAKEFRSSIAWQASRSVRRALRGLKPPGSQSGSEQVPISTLEQFRGRNALSIGL